MITIYKHCCICGMRFEDTDGETQTCGQISCVDVFFEQEEKEANENE